MRKVFFFVLLLLLSVDHADAQQLARDARAATAVQQAVAAMGGSIPADFVATGTVGLIEGSRRESGAIRILGRGLVQAREEINLSDGVRAEVHAQGRAAHKFGDSEKEASLELATSARPAVFPLAWLASVLADSDATVKLLGPGSVEDPSMLRLRIGSTFASRKGWEHLAPFTVRELWLDAKTGLPLMLSYNIRAGGGAAPSVAFEIHYADYRAVSGVLFPHRIEKHLNGTLWQTITIERVAFNTGLTDADFAIAAEVRQ